MLHSSSIIFVVHRRFASRLVCWSRNSIDGGAVFVGQTMIALKFANDAVTVAFRNKGVTISGSCSDRWEDT